VTKATTFTSRKKNSSSVHFTIENNASSLKVIHDGHTTPKENSLILVFKPYFNGITLSQQAKKNHQ
jgi:hypothetical protein